MKKLLKVLFYIFVIIVVIYHISIYESTSLTQILFFTVFVFMLGCIVTLDILNLVAKLAKEKSGE